MKKAIAQADKASRGPGAPWVAVLPWATLDTLTWLACAASVSEVLGGGAKRWSKHTALYGRVYAAGPN